MAGGYGRIAVFEDSIVLPALEEITSSERLLRDFAAEVVVKRPSADPKSEELLSQLGNALRKTPGPSLVLKSREVPPGISAIGGRFVMTVFYDVQGDEVFAAPGVMFWMAFNNKLHAFAHRYDNAIARHEVEKVTRPHVLNHVLSALTFYKLQAFSPDPFPGYR